LSQTAWIVRANRQTGKFGNRVGTVEMTKRHGTRENDRICRRGRRLRFEPLELRQLLAVTTLTPIADTYIQSGGNVGSSTVLDALDMAGNSPGDRIVYLKFDLSGIDLANIESATLTLHKIASTRNDTIVPDRFDIYGLANAPGLTSQSWDELALNASNVGAEYTNTGGNGLDTSPLYNLNQESGADVTEIVNSSITAQRITGDALLAFLHQRAADGGLVTFITEVDANHATESRGWGYASKEHPNTTLHAILELDDGEPPEPPPEPYPENPIVLPRQMERLDRGLVAVRSATTEVYLSWRLLANDSPGVAFDVYRAANGGPSLKLNGSPLTQTTNFIDSTANASVSNEYFVRSVVDGIELEPTSPFLLAANTLVRQYLNIPLQRPSGGQTPDGVNYTYSPNDASVGDLDGDGDYEIVLKWDPSNSKDNSQPEPDTNDPGYTGNVYVDAYTLEGVRLWRIDLGINIRAGAHYTQFLVYDFDGDGRSEVVMKTGPGTIDGTGNDVILPGDDPDADFRNSSGRILTGSEYLTVFDGLSGAALSTIPFAPPRGSVASWGDTYGNRVDRFLATPAYLDGMRPSIVMARGYYAKTVLTAYDWRNGQITERWTFDSTIPGNGIYGGQGNHNLSVADVDGDGKDEIVYGAMVVDDNGEGLYSTGFGHGDAMHVSDMDPTNPGLEVWQIHEPSGVPGADFRDAQNGYTLFSTGINSGEGPGRGVAADVWAGNPGYEFWGTGGLLNRNGNNLGRSPSSTNFLVWWDADPVRELLDGQNNGTGSPRIDKYGTSSDTRLTTLTGALTNNGTKANPALSGDILGDWREEVIVRGIDNQSLRIYTTTIPATTRLVTLMHDSQYRSAIAWQNVGYNQPPHPSFFLGDGMSPPPQPSLFFGGEVAGDYNVDGSADAADYVVWRKFLGTGNNTADGDHNSIVGQSDFIVWKNNFGASNEPGFVSFSAIVPSAMSDHRRITLSDATAAVLPLLFDESTARTISRRNSIKITPLIDGASKQPLPWVTSILVHANERPESFDKNGNVGKLDANTAWLATCHDNRAPWNAWRHDSDLLRGLI
jgi:hypothetical protein